MTNFFFGIYFKSIICFTLFQPKYDRMTTPWSSSIIRRKVAVLNLAAATRIASVVVFGSNLREIIVALKAIQEGEASNQIAIPATMK